MKSKLIGTGTDNFRAEIYPLTESEAADIGHLNHERRRPTAMIQWRVYTETIGNAVHRVCEERPKTALIAVAATMYLGYLVYLTLGMDFRFLRSDVLLYWELSFSIDSIYVPYWVPLYPLIIGLVREVTLGMLPPILLMRMIAGTGYFVSVLTIYKLAKELETPSAFQVALLFAVYPFVGLIYIVYPISDGLATAFLLLCLLYLHRKQWTAFAFFLAMMVLTHKCNWFYALPIAGLVFIKYKESRMYVVLGLVPLVILLVAGALHHQDILWPVRMDAGQNFVSGMIPLVDGVVGGFFTGKVNEIIKGLVVLLLFMITVAVLVSSVRHHFFLGTVIAIGIILIEVWTNHHFVWAMVRHSKVLLLPIAFLSSHYSDRTPGKLRPAQFAALFCASVLSNLAFGYYMTKIYFK